MTTDLERPDVRFLLSKDEHGQEMLDLQIDGIVIDSVNMDPDNAESRDDELRWAKDDLLAFAVDGKWITAQHRDELQKEYWGKDYR